MIIESDVHSWITSTCSSDSLSFREKALLKGSSLNLVTPTNDSPDKNRFLLWVMMINCNFLSKLKEHYLSNFFESASRIF